MRPLLLSGFGTVVRVSGRTLEVDWRSEGRKESYRPQRLSFDAVVVDSLTGSVSFEEHTICSLLSTGWTMVAMTVAPARVEHTALLWQRVEAFQHPGSP